MIEVLREESKDKQIQQQCTVQRKARDRGQKMEWVAREIDAK